jgi:hypothetical protein
MRLDPKLRYLTEIAARQQRRTVSSFIEWAIEHTLESITLREEYDYGGTSMRITLAQEAQTLWDIDEPDRIVKLALRYPELLTHDEQVVWKLIRECGYLWKGRVDGGGNWIWEIQEDSLNFERLREYWELFKRIASGEADKRDLPSIVTTKPLVSKMKSDPSDSFRPLDDDDDLPF